MKEIAFKKAFWSLRILMAAGVVTVLFLSTAAGPAADASAQTPAEPWEMILFGGPGDQYGKAITVKGNQVIVAGCPGQAWLRSYPIPFSTTPQWTLLQAGQEPQSLAATETLFFSIGDAIPPACGAADGCGGTEPKVLFSRYTLEGEHLGCGSHNFFPYRGYEWYYAAAVSNEGGIDYVYAGGNAEQYGWGNSGPFVMAKYDAAGTMVKSVTEPGIDLGSYYTSPQKGMSNVRGLTILNGYLYAAGESWLPYQYEDKGCWDWGQRPVLMKYDFALERVWKCRADINLPYPGYSGQFHAVAALGDTVYAAGRAIPTGGGAGDFDFIVEKFDEFGNRLWHSSWGGLYEDIFTGIVAVGNRLFAVGYSYKSPHTGMKDGDADVVIYEIDPISGCYQLLDTIGGSGVDWAQAVSTDGRDLYIVGHSTSFASAEGNTAGSLEIMLIHYPLNHAPVADGQDVSANAGVAVDITLTASDEDDDELTYTVVSGPSHGDLTGDAPNLVYTAENTYYGPDEFTFSVNDGTEDSDEATVTIAVNHVPVAENQAVSTDEDITLTITLGGLSDVDGDALTYTILSGPAHGAIVMFGEQVVYTPADFYYGPDSFTFQVNDTKVNSNIATVSITVRRVFTFTGFMSPVDNQPAVNSAKAGSTVPVKWLVTDLDGTPISDAASFTSLTSYSVNCESMGDALEEEVIEVYAGSSGLQYMGDGLWQFNWKTPKSYAGQCRVMVLNLADGGAHSASFRFK
ncbi:MAG: PxKF domain-containing protein, partial [Candidatus Aminicenantes bacterium]|nr:PxKF domain-containing protein [Candidatus Aminicenantes bacterium]